jgi:hypothetical protein
MNMALKLREAITKTQNNKRVKLINTYNISVLSTEGENPGVDVAEE